MGKGESHTCEACGGTFESGWSDDDCAAESRARFGADLASDPTMSIVCDDCYAAMSAFFDWPDLPAPERRKTPRPPTR